MKKINVGSNRYFRNSKKGNFLLDTMLVVVILIALGLVGVIAYQIMGDVNTELQQDDDLSDLSKERLQEVEDYMPPVLDGLYVFAFILLWVFLLVSSYFLNTHPIFFLVVVLVLSVVIFVGASLSNFYQDFIAEEDVAIAASSFPMSNFIISNIALVIVAIGFSVAFTLYAKSTT